MQSLSTCLEIIESEISQLKAQQKQPEELYNPIYYILGLGGKRIRPALTLLACNLFSDDIKPAIKPSIALEVFHNFTLIHDDIMDNAPLRRGQPTVHQKWDSNVAILSGDAMQIMAYQLISETDKTILPNVISTFNETAIEVCEGQQYDMNFSLRNNVTIEEYIRMIELKTSVLLAACLKIGALCGCASDTDAQKLYEFGRNLGIAFQIQDDYLDVYGNQHQFGKKVGGDIAENKKTFLLIKALELAKGDHATILQKATNNHYINIDQKIELVRNVYDQLKIPFLTHNTIAEYSAKAFAFLDSVNVDHKRKDILRKIALDLMNREK